MTLWLYDERGYPSGNAGGIVLRDHADWEASGLMVARAEAGAGKVELDVPAGPGLSGGGLSGEGRRA